MVFCMRAYTHRGWAHWQWVSTSFLTEKLNVFLVFLTGFKPSTFRSPVQCSNHWVNLSPRKQRLLLAFKKTNPNTQQVKYERFFNLNKTKQCARLFMVMRTIYYVMYCAFKWGWAHIQREKGRGGGGGGGDRTIDLSWWGGGVTQLVEHWTEKKAVRQCENMNGGQLFVDSCDHIVPAIHSMQLHNLRMRFGILFKKGSFQDRGLTSWR